MGVKGINPFLKKNAPDAFFTMPIANLSGKRIGIDANNWMYTNMAIARKKIINKTDVAVQEPNHNEIRREWFLAAINFIVGWLTYNVTPIFIFDGPDTPDKEKTKAKRRDERIAARAKIDALYQQLNGDILERPANIVDELRKELRNYNNITHDDFELFKMIIRGIGIPCIQAKGDGEQLCSMLCIEGKLAAVFSIDTDNLAYGCPLIITKFSEVCSYDEYGNRVPHLECVRHDRIILGLNITHERFVDLCIMCGCDFNTNIKGVAVIKSFDLLKKFGSIDNLPRNVDITCLNHRRCRELFQYVDCDSITIKTDADDERNNNIGSFDIDKRALINIREHLDLVGISGQIERLIVTYNNVTKSNGGTVESLQLAEPPKYRSQNPAMKINMVIIPEYTAPILNIPYIEQPKPTKFLTLNIISQ